MSFSAFKRARRTSSVPQIAAYRQQHSSLRTPDLSRFLTPNSQSLSSLSFHSLCSLHFSSVQSFKLGAHCGCWACVRLASLAHSSYATLVFAGAWLRLHPISTNRDRSGVDGFPDDLASAFGFAKIVENLRRRARERYPPFVVRRFAPNRPLGALRLPPTALPQVAVLPAVAGCGYSGFITFNDKEDEK